MYNQQDWAPDHVRDLIQERFEKNSATTTSFSFDDAFSEADDSDPNYAFSSIVIRTELARAVSYSQEGEESGDAEESEPLPGPSLDISGTTLDISPLSTKFDSVSLSESPVERISHEGDHYDVQDKPEVTDEGRELRHIRDDSTSEAQHRVVSIEDSHFDPAASDATQESRPPSPPQSELPPDTSASEDEPETPPGQTFHEKSASTLSLPLPPVTRPSATSSSLPPSSVSHKLTRSVGPSLFERVVSKTRPSFLPPKSRDEDQKHMADWEEMMRRSRAAEEKRRKALQDRRLARELQIEQSLHIWEKEILPDWKIVHRNPAMRKRWWAGIPTKLRATMWERAVGNSLALSPDSYRICLARAKRALSAGTFPTTSLGLIEQDVRSTLPSLHIFHPDSGPMYVELKDMLYAWVVSRSDEGLGYMHGTAKVAAMILLNMPASPGFIRHCMRSFYGGLSTKNDRQIFWQNFRHFLADGMPKIYFNFKQHHISPSEYLRDWIVPLFLDHLPFEACARLWDVILLEGDAFLYLPAFLPDKQELLELLRGENKAALEVARREGRLLNAGKYEIYGVDEETLWDRIEFMNDWWKESTWNRLLQRELPDI
ncbi:hypothetical protein BJV77DRAFT_969311 [Russula vinacea]|nr:hypothetical protein BJV77DRAFT_969311 [Russula vinacea]